MTPMPATKTNPSAYPDGPRPHLPGKVRKIRVAWVTPSLARGYFMQPLFREFAKLFPNTVVFTGTWPGFVAGCEGSFQVSLLERVRFLATGGRANGNPSGFTVAHPGVFSRLLHFHPDVCLVRGFDLCTAYALLVKAATGCRVVLLWGGVGPHVSYLDSPARTRLRRLLAKRLDFAVSHTKAGADYLQYVLGVPEWKILQYPYQPADPVTLSRERESGAALRRLQRPAFLYVGRLIREKGLYTLLRACAVLADQGAAFSLILVGEGPEELRLRVAARVLEIDDRVTWAGRVPYTQLGHYYESSEVFVFPSLEDIIGMVVPEAMVFGKPVLCSRYAGAQDMVRHGVNGFVFDPNAPEELARYMARFVERPKLISQFGRKSLEIVSPYTPGAAAATLAGVVSGLISANHKAASEQSLWSEAAKARLLDESRGSSP